jgi:hypothetical protein
MKARCYPLGVLILLIVASGLGEPTAASATSVYELSLGTVSTGSTPTGDAPWLTLAFQDDGTNKVKLTLTSHLTSPNDLKGASKANSVQGLVFNFGGDLNNLQITNGTTNHGYFASFINVSNNGLKVPSSNGFDIGFNWSSQNRFGAGAVETYVITGTGIHALDFMQRNGDGYYAAAHVQDIGEGSGTIYTKTFNAVPIPGAVWLFGSGLLGLVGVRKKFTR